MCPSLLGSIIRHSGGKGEFIPFRRLYILNVRVSATFHSSVPSASYLSLDFDYQPGFGAVTEEPTPCAWERQHFRDPFILKCAILGMIFSSTHVRVAAVQEPDDNVDMVLPSTDMSSIPSWETPKTSHSRGPIHGLPGGWVPFVTQNRKA